MAATPSTARTIRGARPSSVLAQFKEIVKHRELLVNLIRRELKVKYKNSALGFMWSMLNPLLYLAIFSIVIGIFLGKGVPYFYFFLLTGLLSWNLLSASLMGSAGSIVGNASLVTKSFFPREILPLSAIGAALFNFALQLVALIAAMVITGYVTHWNSGMVLLIVSLLVEVLFCIGTGLIVGTLNVYFRDVQYLLELGLLAWFWMTPIIVVIADIQRRLAGHRVFWLLYNLNPMTPIVLGFQRALYSQISPERTTDGVTQKVAVLIDQPLTWYFKHLGYSAVVSLILFAVGLTVFNRLQGRLAEEL